MKPQIAKKAAVAKLFAKVITTPCIAMGLLIGCNDTGSLIKESNSQKLGGTWEFKNQNGVKTGTAIFETQNDIEGNIYILSDDLPLGKTAIAGTFKVNSSKTPQQIDLTFGDLTTQTIYEINSDGQLKIANSVPNQPRPISLDSQPQQLTKISDSTTISSDIKILRSQDLIATSALIREA